MHQADTEVQPTKRQLVILSLLARGYSREEIGRQFCISTATVKFDLDCLRELVGAKNVTHALAVCIGAGHLTVHDDEVVVAERDLMVAVAA